MSRLQGLASCESGHEPKAKNGWDINAQNGDPSCGMFQFTRSTWDDIIPEWIRHHKNAYWSARWQSMGAAWAIKHGYAGRWACAY